MSVIIDKPGFYASKAGKCEVKFIDGDCAFGYHLVEDFPAAWSAVNGECISDHDNGRYDITGPYVEPRKPVEAWAVVTYPDEIYSFYRTKESAEKTQRGFRAARLVYLREYEPSQSSTGD